jgi:hypothetical protein
MVEPPQQREQAIECGELLRRILEPSPRERGVKRGAHFVRATVRNRVMLRLVPFGQALTFGEVQRDTRCGAPVLIGQVAIVALDLRHHDAK